MTSVGSQSTTGWEGGIRKEWSVKCRLYRTSSSGELAVPPVIWLLDEARIFPFTN
jgi:hypothetical protein